MSANYNQILIILDLNGTLLHSTHHIVKGHGYDIKARTKYVYFRPHMKEFLSQLSQDPHVKLAVWTSCKKENAEAIVEQVFKDIPHEFVMNREHCQVIDDSGNTIKDLEVVWKKYPQWSVANTILVDDSVIKAQKQPFNHVIIPDYKATMADTDNGLEIVKEILLKKINQECF